MSDRRKPIDRRARICPKCGYYNLYRDIDQVSGTDKIKCFRDGCDWETDTKRVVISGEDNLLAQKRLVAIGNGY